MSTDDRFVWVEVDEYDRDFITGCLEAGVDGIYSEQEIGEQVAELGRTTTVTPDGQFEPGKDVADVTIQSKEDEKEVLDLAHHEYVVVRAADWMIIPLENLIAQTDNLVAHVDTAEDAKLAIETLEKGVHGVLLDTDDLNEVRDAVNEIKVVTETFELQTCSITNVKQVGSGDRICVDTCSMMNFGEGMLVGNSSGGMFLVHAEVKESEYVASRPFRVNAGGVHAYIRVPGGETKYLSELSAGEDVLIVNHEGQARPSLVGRAKQENRPMMLVEGFVETDEGEQQISLILQNAETINLTTPDGETISVVDLEEDDEVLAYAEEAGRHFGMKVDETIEER